MEDNTVYDVDDDGTNVCNGARDIGKDVAAHGPFSVDTGSFIVTILLMLSGLGGRGGGGGSRRDYNRCTQNTSFRTH